MANSHRPQGKYRPVGRYRTCLLAWPAHESLTCELLEDRRLLSASTLGHVFKAFAPTTPMTAQSLAEAYSTGATPTFGSNTQVGLTPAQIRHAYGFDQIFFANGTIQGDGSGQTIAIVDAFDDPNIVSDLAAFDAFFGIPAPPSFVRLNESGASSPLPGTDPVGSGKVNWEFETALDVEWAHALAPAASILLVEANSASFTDLISNAVDTARNWPDVVAVSMSFGAPEFATEITFDSTFTTPADHVGVTFVGASGDSGFPGIYPAYSPNVLAVGGTSLFLDGNNNITSESAWSGSGGGVSEFEPQPSYQNALAGGISAINRVIPDVAFDADSSTGVAVYDSYNGGTSPWFKVGGTSFSSPAWASLIAIADQGRFLTGLTPMDGPGTTLPEIYTLPGSDFNDITTGSNNHPPDTRFSAQVGYDAVTGRGTPRVNLTVPKENLTASGLVGSSAAAGEVFNDTNANGALDGGEAGLQGWT
ncbi:MAG: S53 family peptidase, partial [Planctomycetia bacterium]|nr:S53 family peptidase [Planctomycetia bacterium]